MAWQRKTDAPYVVVTDAGVWSAALIRWPWLQYLAPALGGEVIDVTTMCQRGPWVPSVTMDDIVWFGVPPNDGRPHTILTVTRAIARQELFAQYCEDPSQAEGWVCMAYGQRSERVYSVNYWDYEPIPVGYTHSRIRIVDDNGHPGECGGEIFMYSEGPPTNLGSYGGFSGHSTGFLSDPVAMPVAATRFSAHGPDFGATYEMQFCNVGVGTYTPPEPVEDPSVTLPDGTGATLDELEVKLDMIQQLLRSRELPNFALDLSTATGANDLVVGDLDDAIGLLVTIVDRPATRTSWSDDPPRFPRLASLTLGNTDGWWPAIDVEHAETIVLPLPPGASRFSVKCQPPMRASVTLYRPTAGP